MELELRRTRNQGSRLGELAALEGEQRTEVSRDRADGRSWPKSRKLQPRIASCQSLAEEADGQLARLRRPSLTAKTGNVWNCVPVRGSSNYLTARLQGRMASRGAEAELSQAAGVEGIPLELWDVPRVGEQRAVTGTPGTTGINLDMIRPAVFAPSIATRLGVEMPTVPSGTFASATISTSPSPLAAKNEEPPTHRKRQRLFNGWVDHGNAEASERASRIATTIDIGGRGGSKRTTSRR